MAKDWPSSFPPWRSRRRKVKGEREEIWSEEEEEEPAGPPFFPLLSLLPSLCPPPYVFFLAVFLGESGRSELNRK